MLKQMFIFHLLRFAGIDYYKPLHRMLTYLFT